MAKIKTLEDAFVETLKDVYYAEKQAVRMLQKASKASQSQELAEAFATHRDESEGQVERLEQVFELLNKPARAKTCEAMQGLNDEMTEALEDFGDSPAADAVLIGAAQAVEHYEIARYGTLKTWANQLGMTEAASLLEETLQEEKHADELLTQIAESIANAEAERGEAEEDEDDEAGGQRRSTKASKSGAKSKRDAA
jgi:ferritin-like metal-binding protein YciE